MNLRVERMGAGRNLVLLHGWGMSGRCWENVASRLAEKYRVHVVDLPGHGASGNSEDDWVEVLADAFDGEVSLCGWSLGGQIAIEWASRRPGTVEKLVLVAATPCFVSRPGWDHGMDSAVFGGFAEALDHEADAVMRRFLHLQAQGGREEKRLFRQLQAYQGQPDERTLKKGLDMLRSADLREKFSALSQPVLVMHGEGDRIVPSGAGKWLFENARRARLESIKDCAHAPFLSHPDFFVSSITEFLDE